MNAGLFGLLIVFSQAVAQTNAPVALFTRFEQTAPGTVLAAMRSELDSIMEPAGFRFLWRELPVSKGGEVHRELVVVSFKGGCRVPGRLASDRVAGALGWTHTTEGELLPFADIHCERILALLSSEFRRMEAEDRDELFGRALGRVLAHELYHILGRTKKHGSCGIAKAAYSLEELTVEELLLDAADIRRLRANRTDRAGEVEAEAGH